MKNICIISFLLLSACGIQAPTAIKRLFPAGAVRVTYSTVGTGTYTVTFQGLNPEDFFSGYNLYYTDNSTAAAIGSGTKVIRTSAASTDPTIPIGDPFNNVTTFSFTMTDSSVTNKIFHSGVPSATPSTFHWFIRAYSVSEALESPYSLSVQTVVDP